MISTLILLFTFLQSTPASRSAADADADAILTKAIEAAGGLDALKRARVLNWRGRATVHAGQREIHLEGRWTVEPPDRASVASLEMDNGEASTRRLTINGTQGTIERDGKTMAMPAEMLANERDQFYLYSVLKLAPLLDASVRLAPIAEGDARGLSVKQQGRPDVQILFDQSGRPTRLRASVLDPGTRQLVPEELQFEGIVEADGVRWPRRIRILQSGILFFDLEITEFNVTR
jgi:hypothetical protein